MVAVITGASRGIGFATAARLCSRSVDVYAVSRNEAGLLELKNYTDKGGKGRLHPVVFDLKLLQGNPGKIRRLLPADLNHIDILINNAGYLANMPFEATGTDEIENMAIVNFISPALLIRELLPLLGKSGISHIVNIGSMGGFQGSTKFSGLSFYSATKAALACLTECLSEEYKETDLIFNCLCLGAVQTEMLAEAFPGFKAQTTSAGMGEYIAEFAINGHRFFKGRVLPVAKSDP